MADRKSDPDEAARSLMADIARRLGSLPRGYVRVFDKWKRGVDHHKPEVREQWRAAADAIDALAAADVERLDPLLANPPRPAQRPKGTGKYEARLPEMAEQIAAGLGPYAAASRVLGPGATKTQIDGLAARWAASQKRD